KVCRRETFNAAHRLFNPSFDDAKNEAIFGKCNNPNYHGHNYVLLVCLDGPVDPETGYVIDLKILSDIIEEEVKEPFDHRNLNLDCPDFENIIPTAENITFVIWNKLRKRIAEQYSLEITLWETDRNSVYYNGK
ncbi:MAG: 6-carboxytetrahydropterin synthase, partial [Crocinitomicaceae bacterium]|nr:6-carboxytetrahydropterin synthase [Crocinitomicaceae bacterium]